MEIKYADFVGSFPLYTLCPKNNMPEYAFIGRSNVGKSSLINMLLNRQGLAKVSGKPGKTQSLNFYQINGSWHIVDLPGYGYAKISKTERAKWEKMINGYLTHRENLVCAFILIDSNVPPQQIDIEFIKTLGVMQVPFAIAYTKADKSKKKEIVEANIENFRQKLLEDWEEMPQEFITSANKKGGREEILEFVEKLNEEYKSFYDNL